MLDHECRRPGLLDKRYADEEKQKPEAQRSSMGVERLRFVADNPSERITYTEAIRILQDSKPYKKKKFQFPVEWGRDLQSEHALSRGEALQQTGDRDRLPGGDQGLLHAHERTGRPGPQRPWDPPWPPWTCSSPASAIIGGSQREERLEQLKERMAAMDIPRRTPGHAGSSAPCRVRRFRPGPGALRAVRDRHGQHPTRSLPADAGGRGSSDHW